MALKYSQLSFFTSPYKKILFLTALKHTLQLYENSCKYFHPTIVAKLSVFQSDTYWVVIQSEINENSSNTFVSWLLLINICSISASINFYITALYSFRRISSLSNHLLPIRRTNRVYNLWIFYKVTWRIST